MLSYSKNSIIFFCTRNLQFVGLFSSLSKPRPSIFLAPQQHIIKQVDRSYSGKNLSFRKTKGGKDFTQNILHAADFHLLKPLAANWFIASAKPCAKGVWNRLCRHKIYFLCIGRNRVISLPDHVAANTIFHRGFVHKDLLS